LVSFEFTTQTKVGGNGDTAPTTPNFHFGIVLIF
jgi:hypothetical protein